MEMYSYYWNMIFSYQFYYQEQKQNLLASISGNNVPEKVNDNNHNNDTTKLYLCQ